MLQQKKQCPVYLLGAHHVQKHSAENLEQAVNALQENPDLKGVVEDLSRSRKCLYAALLVEMYRLKKHKLILNTARDMRS